MPQQSKPSRIITALKQPPILTIQSLLQRMPGSLLEIAPFCLLQLTSNPSLPTCNSAVDIRLGTGGDIAALTRCVDKGNKFAERFAQNNLCLIANIDREVAGYLWFCVDEQYLEESWKYKFSIPSHAVYSYDIYVKPCYRRKGIFYQLYGGLSEWMRSNEKDSILTIIDYGNQLSLKIHSRIGFKPIQSILALRILNFRFFIPRSRAAYSSTISF